METLKFIAGRAGIATSAALAVVLGTSLLLAGSASAQTTPPADPVEDGFADMLTKIGIYGGLIVGLVVLSASIFLGVKYLRRGTSKA